MSALPMEDSQRRARVSVDHNRCAGHGVCLIHAKTIFDMDDEGYSVVVTEILSDPADIDSARSAEMNCPERAIQVEEL